MIEDIGLFQLASLKAKHAAERQRLVADNIANANTPNFKARDLRPFEEEFAKFLTNSEEKFEAIETHLPGGAAPNGNTVSLENELLKSADAASQHDTALLVYRKAMDILRASLRVR